MKILRPTLLVASLALLAACATEPSGPPPVSRQNGGTRMTVVGKDGWQFNRVLRFGDFSTSPVGPTSTRTTSPACCDESRGFSAGPFRKQFDARFETATSKIAFVQKSSSGLEANVHAIDQAATHDVEWSTSWFGFPTAIGGINEVRTSLEGTIEAVGADRPTWHFALFQDSTRVDFATPMGWAADDAGHRVVVKHMPPPAGLPPALQNLMHGVGPGVRFELDGQLVGEVDQMPPATVWLRDDLPPDVRVALAGLSTTLLLRPQGR